MPSVQRWVTRSDAWTPEDDARLASLVLQHIRSGSTQLRAFEEAASQLGRTAAACGYRWNGVVRKRYRDEIEAAKRERKAGQRRANQTAAAGQETHAVTVTTADSMKDVIKFLQTFSEQYQNLLQQVEALAAENAKLQQRVEELTAQLAKAQEAVPAITPEQLEEDSKALFAIMERARKLLEAEGPRLPNE
ncbi:hypothetical protein GCM10010885_13520 [Alicyclobacillus cellulosilyticus]|uniref:Prespore-specific regulator n=1 Tax=Alicyclobacillus cellulosilyticus TaxID=1003997 RepID=A0A917KCP9_9BACL|nr:RsfA family transcriptional regulator [Alicyclobacillus cellulosilyticus]GGJ05681.1 hypothetical protein GCM10010885_13520 [Alicyclobacillus cellulosilyticus]